MHNVQLENNHEDSFNEIYDRLKNILVLEKPHGNEKCTIILGGQPGAGKSSYYANNNKIADYVKIDGDTFRVYHPDYERIIKTDSEHFAERTQTFVNYMVERLISDLGNDGYNMIIEGTLRNPNVPIKTCNELKTKGYFPELIVIACDAETAWKSTIKRAQLALFSNEPVRFVPIDIYDYTVNHLPENIEKISNEKCFRKITIMDRDGSILFSDESNTQTPKETMEMILNLDNWNAKLEMYETDFIQRKIELLENQLSARNNKNSLTL